MGEKNKRRSKQIKRIFHNKYLQMETTEEENNKNKQQKINRKEQEKGKPSTPNRNRKEYIF